MDVKSGMKIAIWLILGIIIYIVIELLIQDAVIAKAAEMQKGNEDMFPFYWLLLTVGGIIIITLTYVSWRKYKGEKEHKSKRENDKIID